MYKSTFLALALLAVTASQARASLTTVFLSTDPVTSAPLATSPTDSLTQDLTGFTVDQTASTESGFGSLTIAVDGDNNPGYDTLTLTLTGTYIAPFKLDGNGDPDTISMYSGSKVLYDRTSMATPLVNSALLQQDFAVAGTVTPFSLSYTVTNPTPIASTKFQVENFFYIPAGAAITFDKATVVGTVPEPASMAVLGLGLAALKRRRKSAK